MSGSTLKLYSGRMPPIARLARVALGLIVLSIVASFINAESFDRSGVSLVWLANGLLIGVLLCAPRRQWIPFLALGYGIDFCLNVVQAIPLSTALFYSVCNMTEVIVAAFSLYKAIAHAPDLKEARQLRSFLLYGVVLAPAVTSSIAAIYMWLLHRTAFILTFRGWFAADLLGIAMATPLYLSYHLGLRFSVRSKLETSGLFLLLTGTTVAIFSLSAYPMLWLVLLILLLLGVRLGFTASALGLLVVTFIGGYLTVRGHGPIRPELPGSLAARIFFFQTFIAFAMLTLYATEVAMTASRRVRLRLEASEMRFRSLAEASRDVIVLAELTGSRMYTSPAVTELLGWNQEDMVGQPYSHLAHPEDVLKLGKLLEQLRQGQEASPLAYRCRKKDGSYLWLEATARLLRNEKTNEPYGFVYVLRDISDRKAAEEQMQEAFQTVERLAMLDGLTGLPNRRVLDQTLNREWISSKRDRSTLSLLLIDVDHFKAFNDLYGHLKGDECLRQVAERIQTVLRRPLDVLARYGGEEFVAVLPNTSVEGVEVIAELVRAAIENCRIPHANSPHEVVTVSIGCATCVPTDASSVTALLDTADAALYAAKSAGRNQVHMASVATSSLPQAVSSGHGPER
jgi:diguanylate cyclase (GGDEF)-like protein/PAS domain S-box-containing protein